MPSGHAEPHHAHHPNARRLDARRCRGNHARGDRSRRLRFREEITEEALRDWSRARDAELAYLHEAVRIGDESGPPSIPAEQVYAEFYAMIDDMRRERV